MWLLKTPVNKIDEHFADEKCNGLFGEIEKALLAEQLLIYAKNQKQRNEKEKNAWKHRYLPVSEVSLSFFCILFLQWGKGDEAACVLVYRTALKTAGLKKLAQEKNKLYELENGLWTQNATWLSDHYGNSGANKAHYNRCLLLLITGGTYTIRARELKGRDFRGFGTNALEDTAQWIGYLYHSIFSTKRHLFQSV